ncbi:Disulfide-bond oxidoreductase YfcG [Andreprevotia sp. IGB-42]|uniref:glutathione S-transferase family protein n=1 Tax=Andreprevotia sp. IGB-42 TaxID=2497473 RepID=UPI00135AC930|nr:glutathione S-transferase [Andreprevotia sp. IGB-42]KAF0813034.1 Disulfide-bond oxidoreductase YfcG [Andreprevotia sp. IGB-42]
MIIVHHLNNSRSQRVLWLLEELGVDYEIQHYQRNPATLLAPPELRAVHPLGKSPVISDADLVVAESGAIIEYLLDRYGEGDLRPASDTAERHQFTYWLHYAEGSAMPLFVMRLVFMRLSHPPVPWLLRPLASLLAKGVIGSYIDPQIATHLAFQEATLARQPWFAGNDFSAADIQMSFAVEAAEARNGLAPYPHLADWLARIRARPTYRQALARGGPYTLQR